MSSQTIGQAPSAETPAHHAEPHAPPGLSQGQDRVSLRSILLGAMLCAVLSVCAPYGTNIIQGSSITLDHTALGPIAMLFALTFLTNTLARRLDRRRPRSSLAWGTAAVAGLGVLLVGLGQVMPAYGPETGSLLAMAHLLRVLATATWVVWLAMVASRLAEAALRGGTWLSLSRAELLTVFAMLLICSGVVTMGVMMHLIPTLPAAEYFGNAQNRWPDTLLPYIPDWARVTDRDAVNGFFEGLPRIGGYVEPQRDRFALPAVQGLYEAWTHLRQIPWHGWVRPLLGWSIFLLPLYAFMICSMILIRGQWMDREILSYPLARLPQEMAVTHDGKTPDEAVGPLFRNPWLWMGFTVPMAYCLLRSLHYYWPAFPTVPEYYSTKILADQATIFIWPSFVTLGFAYLINTRISFSIWTLALAGVFLSGWMALRGYKSPEHLSDYGTADKPFFYHLGMGALLTMAVVGLWSARGHLARVWRKALHNDPRIDDSHEVLGYRAATIVCVLSAAVMLAWLMAIGMTWWVACTFWLLMVLTFYGVTRIVVEAGLGACVAPGIAPVFTVSKLGATAMPAESIVALGLQYPYCADIRTFTMVAAAHGLKITHDIRHGKRRIFGAMIVALLVTLAVSAATTIYLAYVHQGTSLNTWYFINAPQLGLSYVTRILQQQPEANAVGWVASAVGAGLMLLLMLANRRFLAWPLHPLGLAVMGIHLMDKLWVNLFLAWLIKTLVLKYGGPRVYTKTIPLALGLILGQAVAAGLWLLIDYVTGTVGHSVFLI